MQILEGHFSADDSARLCRNYRYACERMTRIMAGWIALTPELSAKLLLGGVTARVVEARVAGEAATGGLVALVYDHFTLVEIAIVLVIIGVALIVLAPAKQSGELRSAVSA